MRGRGRGRGEGDRGEEWGGMGSGDGVWGVEDWEDWEDWEDVNTRGGGVLGRWWIRGEIYGTRLGMG